MLDSTDWHNGNVLLPQGNYWECSVLCCTPHCHACAQVKQISCSHRCAYFKYSTISKRLLKMYKPSYRSSVCVRFTLHSFSKNVPHILIINCS